MILSMDISGNFEEGKGTTGFAVISKEGNIESLGSVKAKDFDTAEEYWGNITQLIDIVSPEDVVIEGYRLYHHKGQSASSQANSVLETPQLVGVLRYHCWKESYNLTIQYASQVKSRWSDSVLKNTGIMEEGNTINGMKTNNHIRDAVRHGLHFHRYGKKE